MEVRCADPVQQGHLKQITPANVRKTVSTASIFKQQIRKGKQIDGTLKENLDTSRSAVKDASMHQSMGVKAQFISPSPPKAGGRVTRNRPSMHPLAVAYRGKTKWLPCAVLRLMNRCVDTSDNYRRHLYKSATLKIQQTLDALLNTLYERSLQNIPSESINQDPQALPLRLSASAKYEQMAQKLYQPLSQYRLGLHRINTQGERERFQKTLDIRMVHYKEYLSKQVHEITQLQKEWEVVVGEIWKLGVHCLGKAVMEDLLFTNRGAIGACLPSRDTDTESTLFVPEVGTSPPPHKIRTSNKCVTFEASDVHETDYITPISEFPEFIYQPLRYCNKPFPSVPAVEEAEISEIEIQINELGQLQLEELRKIERDYQAYWKKKTAQLATALKDD